MNLKNTTATLLLLLCTIAASYAQQKEVLSAEAFSQKLAQSQQGQVLDVRTQEEFSENHLKNAFNADFTKSDEFGERIKYLDKNNPVFVYCLSGGRSARAADYLLQQGFTQVYDMEGGVRSWMAGNKPLETSGKATKKAGMSLQAFDKFLAQHDSKLVLVNFNARWCPPCKKMAPELESLAKDLSDSFVLIPLDVDQNQLLSKEKKAIVLPTLLLYKDGKVVWQKEGYASKGEITEQINKYK
jgi:thioredoxin